MKTSDFDFFVPPELIAHEPALVRDQSRLMIVDRPDVKSGSRSIKYNNGNRDEKLNVEHRKFYDIIDYLHEGDLLVLNDTKVIPANLVGKKEGSGGKVEVLLVKRYPIAEKLKSGKADQENWLCLVKPGKRLSVGSRMIFGDGELIGTCVEKLENGEQIISFEAEDFWGAVQKLGEVPLPPYISEVNSGQWTVDSKAKRYQTVYADKEGASAAPTAGLHFTPELLEKIKAKGIKIAYLTLHTGLGTFQPVRAENIEDHPMHEEYFEIPEETWDAVEQAKRVVAVGTTSVRALESTTKTLRHKGNTKLFIYPGFEFKIVKAMITNFHWPKTTLVMLVSAFAGKDLIMKAYQEAIDQKYRFFSFGDAMLIV